MKEALVDERRIQASPNSPETALCPSCRGEVQKRKRTAQGHTAFYYCHKAGEGNKCPQRRRGIPAKLVAKLLEGGRYRCCVYSPQCNRRHLPPGEYDVKALARTLDKHHIRLFSEGGQHAEDNLLLACDNCHRQIHEDPKGYTAKELKRLKMHFIEMHDVVPAELELPGVGEKTIQVTFSMETVNLQYTITAPPQATVAELALFVREMIHKPLGEYDGNKEWIKAEGIELARRSASGTPLDPDLPLEKVHLVPDDVLVARIEQPTVTVVVPPIPAPLGEGKPEAQESITEPPLREVTPERERDRPIWERRHPFEPEMVFVPAGEFWMGSDKRKDSQAYSDELPQHEVTLPDYWIGRYPVTNAEYRAFVGGRGYRTRAYWTEAGWKWKRDRAQPYYWNDKNYNDPRQPVVGVSWYEAVAYCHWLSARMGREYRLPSEAQWEKAARGSDGRIWPWGDEKPDENLCNFSGNVGKPTLVGKYSPEGDSPYDCADMAGNVWEWCATKWEGSYENYRGDDDLEGDARRVLRGGAFNLNTGYVRCACRYHYLPPYYWGYSGFRVVVAAPFSRPARSEA